MTLTRPITSKSDTGEYELSAYSGSFSIANNGTVFYFLTNKDAPQYKLISVDISEPPEQRHPKEVIPEDKDAQLEDICVVNNDILAVVYKRNVSHLRLY